MVSRAQMRGGQLAVVRHVDPAKSTCKPHVAKFGVSQAILAPSRGVNGPPRRLSINVKTQRPGNTCSFQAIGTRSKPYAMRPYCSYLLFSVLRPLITAVVMPAAPWIDYCSGGCGRARRGTRLGEQPIRPWGHATSACEILQGASGGRLRVWLNIKAAFLIIWA